MTQKHDPQPAQAQPQDRVEASKAQQVAAGGPDPDATRGDTGPGTRPRAGGERGTPGRAAKGTGPRYVVLHNMVGSHERGQVVAESQFPEGTDFDRLQDVGAVRPAEGDEHGMDKVTVVSTARPEAGQTYERLIADKDREIQQLQAEKAEMQTKEAARMAQAAGEDANRQSAAVTTLIDQKDRRIAELERRNRELEMQAGGAGKSGAGDRGEQANPPDYESWTVEQLHAEAAKRDLHGRGTLDKAGLVKALQKADKK